MDNIHVTAMYGAISALATGLAWVAKLFYVDVKKSLAECETRHDKTKVEYEQRLLEEKKDCETQLNEQKSIISNLQSQINILTHNVFELMKGHTDGPAK